MKIKLFAALTLLVVMLALSVSSVAQAGELDKLMDALVEKGYFTPLEAQIILDETKAQVAKDISQGKAYSLPGWVQRTKLKGDVRVRYQYQRKHMDTEGRSRGRIRYRLGIQSKVNDEWKVAAGLASGGDDPRSTNQTFDSTFDTGDIRLDYAYAEYTPTDWVEIITGKFPRKKYLYNTTDLLWDGDINPEGGSAKFTKGLTKHTDGFLNTGVWVIEENGAVDMPDPFLYYTQGGVAWDGGGKIKGRAAGIYYGFNGVKGASFTNANSTNSRSGGLFMYDYDSFGFSGELTVKEPLEQLPVNQVTVFGDYINNIDESVDERAGWAAGVKFGDKKVKKKGQWQAKYIYARLGKDAWLDAFPDSDRLSGKTNVQSHEGVLTYGINKNTSIGIDYYDSVEIKGSKNRERLIQSDLIVKF